MTLDEAHLILNTKREEALEAVLKVRLVPPLIAGLIVTLENGQNYEHLFKMNSPPPPPETVKPRLAGKQPSYVPTNSHYLQSKVVRARERIEAELKVVTEDASVEAATSHEVPTPPPPQEKGRKNP